VTVSATVADDGSGIETVQADARAFDAGTVELTDEDGDGTYDATFSVGSIPTEGEQAVSITATDRVGRTTTVETDESLIVDTTAPDIGTFFVSDDSSSWFIFFTESFQIQWETSNEHLAETTVYVNRSGVTQEMYSGRNGDKTYTDMRILALGREYTITIVAVDDAGNRACRSVTDTADGSGPPSSAYESC